MLKVPAVIVKLVVSRLSCAVQPPEALLNLISLKSSLAAVSAVVVMVFPVAPASNTTRPVPAVNVLAPVIDQLPATVNDVSSAAVGAVKVPLEIVTSLSASISPLLAV